MSVLWLWLWGFLVISSPLMLMLKLLGFITFSWWFVAAPWLAIAGFIVSFVVWIIVTDTNPFQ